MSTADTGAGQAPVDWDELRRTAVTAAASAYAPYSGLHVGAAAIADDGRVLTGCNVENASYGLALCAECGLVSSLVASGGGRLVALACRSGAGALLMPCGRCRTGPSARRWPPSRRSRRTARAGTGRARGRP